MSSRGTGRKTRSGRLQRELQLTPEKHAFIKQSYKDGVTARHLAELYGLPIQTIYILVRS